MGNTYEVRFMEGGQVLHTSSSLDDAYDFAYGEANRHGIPFQVHRNGARLCSVDPRADHDDRCARGDE